MLCETKLSAKKTYNLEGYITFQKNQNVHSGGLIIAIKNCFAGSAIEVSDVLNHNIMSIQIRCKDKRIRIIIAYGPQENELKKEKEQFYDDLNVAIERAKLNKELILISGDLNAKLEKDIISGDQHETSPNGAFH